MAPHFVFVRGTPGPTSAAAKRQQTASGTATATNGKKKQGQGNGKKKAGVAASTAVPVSTETGKGRKRRGGKKAAKRTSPCANSGPSWQTVSGNQAYFAQERQQVNQTQLALQPQGTLKKAALKPPVPVRKPVAAGESALPSQPTPTSRQHSFSSSASTLVASNAGTPYLSPPLSPNNLTQQYSGPPTVPPNANEKPSILFRPTQLHRKASEPTASDPILAKLSSVLTSIDGESFSGKEDELNILHYNELTADLRPRGGFVSNSLIDPAANPLAVVPKQPPKKTNLFTKVHLYANARLPPNLPLFRV